MSLDKPKISIIVPVYNTANYLEECLDSLVNQSLEDIEIICIDDKSEDNSPKILEKYASKDKRIKVLYNKENTGQAIARNIAMKSVKGEYIAFMDSDDKVDLDGYEKVLNFCEKNNLDMVLFDVVRFDKKGIIGGSELHEKSIQKESKKTSILEDMEFVYDTSPCNKLIKTSLIRDNNIEFIDKLYEDLLFSMELFCSTDSVGVLPDVKYYWRRRRDGQNKSTTQNRTNKKNIADRIFIINKIEDLFKSNEKYDCLLDSYHFKLLEIDYRLFIDQIDIGDSDYRAFIIETIKPIIENYPKELFENLSMINKIKYDFLIEDKIDELIYIREKERNYNFYSKQNQRLNQEIKTVKSTKGWINYKKDNLTTRFKSKMSKNNGD
ncbi:glycosyltransferase family 2 protein [Methanobrevibacter sp.]